MLQQSDAELPAAATGRRVIRLNPGPLGPLRETQPVSAALLNSLSDLVRAVNEAQNPLQLAAQVVQCACQALAADSAALYLWNEPSDRLRLACSSEGQDAADPHIAPDESLVGYVFSEQRPLLINDYPAWRKASRSFEPAGFGAAAAVPLSTQQRAIGALVVRFQSTVVDPAVLDVLSLLGMLASTPLETAELRVRLHEEEKLDGALRRMTQALAAHETEGRVLWLAARYASQLLKAPRARVWLLEDDGHLVCAAAEGDLEPDPIGVRLPPDSVAGLIVSTGPLNLTDATAHPAWYKLAPSEPAGFPAYVGAPMRRAGRSLGVLSVMRGAPFDRSAEHLLTTLADASAAAVDNARALARVQELELELRQTQQRYRLLFEHNPIAALELDAEGRITGANAAWERLTGQSSENALGHSFVSFEAEPSVSITPPLGALPKQESIAREVEILDATGQLVGVRATRLPLTIDNRLLSVYEFVEDVTERKRNERILLSRTRRQAALGDLALWTLTGADLDEILQASVNALAAAVDAEFATLYELDAVGDHLTLRAAAGDGFEFRGDVRIPAGPSSQAGYTLLQGEPVVIDDLTTECRFTPDQRLRSCGMSSSVSMVITGRGQPFGVIAAYSRGRQFFSEPSAAFARTFAHILGLAIVHRRSEEALYRRDQEVTALVEHIPDLVMRLDRELQFTFVNPSVEWATGRPASSFLGRGLDALSLPEGKQQFVELRFKHVFRTGRAQAFDMQLSGAAAQQDYEALLIPELARDGSVSSVLALARDVTERRQVQAQREDQQRQLLAHEQRLQELIGQVVASQVHEQHRRAELAKLEPLSAREQQVLRSLAHGRTNAEIALELGVSAGTVKNHISRILPKLGAIDRTHAAARAVELGLAGM
jgi:PAS domain S-box-containing protein